MNRPGFIAALGALFAAPTIAKALPPALPVFVPVEKELFLGTDILAFEYVAPTRMLHSMAFGPAYTLPVDTEEIWAVQNGDAIKLLNEKGVEGVRAR